MYEIFTAMARRISTQENPVATVETIVAEAVAVIDGAEHASITRRVGTQGPYRTIAATGDLAIQVDEIQYETRSGPCLDALADQHVFRSDDLAADTRWPEFARRATDRTPVVSMLAHRLHLDEDTSLAALNLYSTKPAAFAAVDHNVLNSLATLSAIAIAKADAESQRDSLQAALASNRRIGAAVGIVMARYRVTYEDGFTYLRVASQHQHLKLAVVAEDVLETGELNLPK